MGDLRNSVPAPSSVALSHYHNIRKDMCVNTAPLPSFLMQIATMFTYNRSKSGWGENVIILIIVTAIKKGSIQKAELCNKQELT